MTDDAEEYPRMFQRDFLIVLASTIVSLALSTQGLAGTAANPTSSSMDLASLSGNYTDHGIDVNQDGRYDFLAVNVGVDVQTPGEYSVMGSLYDHNHEEVIWAIDHKRLYPGHNRMELDFDGKAIQSHLVDGPYRLGDVKLTYGSSNLGMILIENIPTAYNTSFYRASDFVDPVRRDKIISGSGIGELLLTITIKSSLPVFSGKYSFDIVGINIPPFSSEFDVTPKKGLAGYAYDLAGISLPGKPNNFTVSARPVNDINIGLKKLPVKNGINHTRIWVTTQIPADSNGIATADSDLLSPGNYQAKIFGDAADNASRVDLTMTMVKKMIVRGRFNLSINTSGFPSGNYSISAKALNGSLSLDELAVDGLSMAN
jgi:hypothetical protein